MGQLRRSQAAGAGIRRIVSGLVLKVQKALKTNSSQNLASFWRETKPASSVGKFRAGIINNPSNLGKIPVEGT
jgi:hypothetical protein